MKNTQEFFTLGVSKPTMRDVQDYLNRLGSSVPVSYTHLTLPTILLV